jgi:hypothetical protein
VPRVCSICAHPERPAIEADLIAGQATFRSIAKRYGTSPAALTRHKADHLPTFLATAKAAAEVANAGTLLEQVKSLRDRTLALLEKAEEAGDLRTAFAGIREARGCLALLGEIEGELDRRPVINLIGSDEWRALLTAILEALAPYPAARVAAADAVAALGTGDGR